MVAKQEEKQEESLIYRCSTLEEANNVRNEIISQFSDIWIYVFKISNDIFEIRAANNFGGKLKKNMIELLSTFSVDFTKQFRTSSLS